eukprot:2332593-Prymnesium_polylepis.1
MRVGVMTRRATRRAIRVRGHLQLRSRPRQLWPHRLGILLPLALPVRRVRPHAHGARGAGVSARPFRRRMPPARPSAPLGRPSRPERGHLGDWLLLCGEHRQLDGEW